MKRTLAGLVIALCALSACGGGSGEDGQPDATTPPPPPIAETTTTTLARTEQVILNDPVTGRTMTFAEFVDVRGLTHVDTKYGDVWLDRIKGDPIFPDGVAFMVENCSNLDAQDLDRTEQIQALTLQCYG